MFPNRGGFDMKARGSLSAFMAFFIGVPAGMGLLFLINNGIIPLDKDLAEYISHPVEMAEVVMFCCALGALLGKCLSNMTERMAFLRKLLPAWDSQPHSVAEAKTLLNQLEQQPAGVRNTFLGRRVAAILDFVDSRGAANDLDDHIRTLSDNDMMTVETSYSLLRFITWAIPILGFLGTVVGITGAIQHVDPKSLEAEGLTAVTSALSTAFNATALALSLTMVLMFLSFLVERLEQTVLEQVDRFVDLQLTHRFERTGSESGKYVEALRQNTQILVKAMEQLVERQAGVWSRSMEKADRLFNETGRQQQEMMSASLIDALETTMTSHTQALEEMEKRMLARSQEVFAGIAERTQSMVDGLSALATVLRETGRQHQSTLSDLSERIAGQTHSLTKLQEGEGQLVRMQELLQQNLSALSSSGSFEQAVLSLTAAIHLMTTRIPGATPSATGPRLSGRAA
jgi:biopolymer transport protein ExbB/TolQ